VELPFIQVFGRHAYRCWAAWCRWRALYDDVVTMFLCHLSDVAAAAGISSIPVTIPIPGVLQAFRAVFSVTCHYAYSERWAGGALLRLRQPMY